VPDKAKSEILKVTPVRVDPDADKISKVLADELGISKPALMSEALRCLAQILEGDPEPKLLRMLRAAMNQPRQMSDFPEEIQSMLKGSITEAVEKALSGKGVFELNELPTPYKVKPSPKKRRKAE
tara:strand:+ start:489 stop:863 length:375 start_codon:yes stop_codon:yes gene_type:complete